MRTYVFVLLCIIFSTGLARAGGVTNIKEVVNRSSQAVRLTTYEDKGDVESKWKMTGKIAAGTTWHGEMWIPWADNQEQFNHHFLKIEFFRQYPRRNLYHVNVVTLYQSGESVRMDPSPDNSYDTPQILEEVNIELPLAGYNSAAALVEGESRSGGERRVVFFDKPDGSVGFRFERYSR
jgi:hypothetical protein